MEENKLGREYELVVVGGSAGSLQVLIRMLDELKTTTLAIVLVLHRSDSRDFGLANLLGMKSAFQVKEAEEKEFIKPATVYIAPADYHLLIEKNHSFSLDYSEKVNFSRPSIDVTFECAADVYGKRVIGILLSGGNSDGAAGLKAINRAGGFSIVQDPQSSRAPFMPQHAIDLVKVDKVVAGDAIASYLNRNFSAGSKE